MTIALTTNGKQFIWDRVTYVLTLAGIRYFKTGTGNIVRENDNGTFDEIPRATVEANILLLPYAVAAEMFPNNPNLIETI
jgi:hypothetical protein